METILASPPIAFSIAWAVLVVFGQCTAQFLPVTRRASVTPFSLAAAEFFTFEEAVLEGRVVEDPEPAVLLLLLPQAAMTTIAMITSPAFKGRRFMRR